MPSCITTFNAPHATNPLQFLARVALEPHSLSTSQYPFSARVTDGVPPRWPKNTPTTLHIDCGQSATTPHTSPKPLKRSSTSNSTQSSESSAATGKSSNSKPKKQTRKTSRDLQKTRAEMRMRRREYLTRAVKINTLDNSPVNDQQYALLRVVYDEITMYPSEPWMVMIALVIHR